MSVEGEELTPYSGDGGHWLLNLLVLPDELFVDSVFPSLRYDDAVHLALTCRQMLDLFLNTPSLHRSILRSSISLARLSSGLFRADTPSAARQAPFSSSRLASTDLRLSPSASSLFLYDLTFRLRMCINSDHPLDGIYRGRVPLFDLLDGKEVCLRCITSFRQDELNDGSRFDTEKTLVVLLFKIEELCPSRITSIQSIRIRFDDPELVLGCLGEIEIRDLTEEANSLLGRSAEGSEELVVRAVEYNPLLHFASARRIDVEDPESFSIDLRKMCLESLQVSEECENAVLRRADENTKISDSPSVFGFVRLRGSNLRESGLFLAEIDPVDCSVIGVYGNPHLLLETCGAATLSTCQLDDDTSVLVYCSSFCSESTAAVICCENGVAARKRMFGPLDRPFNATMPAPTGGVDFVGFFGFYRKESDYSNTDCTTISLLGGSTSNWEDFRVVTNYEMADLRDVMSVTALEENEYEGNLVVASSWRRSEEERKRGGFVSIWDADRATLLHDTEASAYFDIASSPEIGRKTFVSVGRARDSTRGERGVVQIWDTRSLSDNGPKGPTSIELGKISLSQVRLFDQTLVSQTGWTKRRVNTVGMGAWDIRMLEEGPLTAIQVRPRHIRGKVNRRNLACDDYFYQSPILRVKGGRDLMKWEFVDCYTQEFLLTRCSLDGKTHHMWDFQTNCNAVALEIPSQFTTRRR